MPNINWILAANLNLTTVRTAVETGAKCFDDAGLYYGHGTATAIDEAAYLVSYALGLSPMIPQDKIESKLTNSQREKIKSLFQIRVDKKIPAAYVTNEAWFVGYQFYVDERVLVPRSPIAELIEKKFSPWVLFENNTQIAILDLCTGSGCLAIAIALTLSDVIVHASDISSDALDVAKININNYDLFNRITLIQSDVFDSIEPRLYDLIVSNPPYVDATDMSNLHAEFLAEPKLGLAAGQQGLDIVIPMLRDADRYLSENGVLIIEVGNSAEALQSIFPEVAFTWLEFEYGGDGVFLLEANQVRKYHHLFENKC